MADNHWKDMLQQTDMVTYTPSKDEPNIYSKYFDSKGNNKSSYKLFYGLRDGHSADPRFYDISGHVGFSAIISLD